MKITFSLALEILTYLNSFKDVSVLKMFHVKTGFYTFEWTVSKTENYKEINYIYSWEIKPKETLDNICLKSCYKNTNENSVERVKSFFEKKLTDFIKKKNKKESKK